jgi:methanol--5-hydroxybenzimidazolylcobamide Co-methyltransferase
MNTAKQLKQDKLLRDLYMSTDRFRSPEGFCLAYDNAFKIGTAIVENGNDIYLRSKAAGQKAAELMTEANEKGALKMSKHEADMLRKIVTDLAALPTEQDRFVEQCLKDYKGIPMWNPKNYDL